MAPFDLNELSELEFDAYVLSRVNANRGVTILEAFNRFADPHRSMYVMELQFDRWKAAISRSIRAGKIKPHKNSKTIQRI
jgi:hypothetical protein